MHIDFFSHVGPEPCDWVERRLPAPVDGPGGGGEVGVLEELPPVPAEALDVLVVGLLQAPLEAAVHGPVPGQGGLLVVLEKRRVGENV